MINVVQGQELLVYVLDADTKQLIKKNLKYSGYNSPMDPGYTFYELIPGGILRYKYSTDSVNKISMDFNLDESQLTELGYDYNSITGNKIIQSYDPELGVYSFPSVAIIYMSKLK